MVTIERSVSAERVAAPTLPGPTPPARFPVLGVVAPMLMSLVMWLVTQSPYVLLFAILGPVVAIASVADNRLAARRRGKQELAAFRAQIRVALEAVSAAHDSERSALEKIAPASRRLAVARPRDVVTWHLPALPLIVIGSGALSSSVTVEGSPPPPWDHSIAATLLGELRSTAATLSGAPITVDATGGIAVVGPSGIRDAVARSVLVQLSARLSPAEYDAVVGDQHLREAWVTALPHAVKVGSGGAAGFRRRGDETCEFTVCTADDRSTVPAHIASVVVVDGFRGQVETAGSMQEVIPDRLSADAATEWAHRLARFAREENVGDASPSIPDTVVFAMLAKGPIAGNDGSLCARIGIGRDGPQVADLVSDGPHAIVGGMTGSGKSELLISWVLSMAATHSPAAVNFLFVDFKGGSTFRALQALPHCVGMITDLDAPGAERALASLAAELRAREERLLDAGVRDVRDLGDALRLARLVIVVDEFAALATDFPELNTQFSDMAARGRSLGVHLILCTQRPASSIREAVLANAGLRISLRVNNRSDSTSVIGTDAAAALPASPPGRALISIATQAPVLVQVPIAQTDDVFSIAASWSEKSWHVHRPWLDPLPAVLPIAEISKQSRALEATNGGLARSISFGLSDRPELQSQPVATYTPVDDGHLLVIGATRSGKSNLLEVLAHGTTRDLCASMPADIEGAWDFVAGDPPRRPGLVFIDDLDLLVSRMPDEYTAGFLDRIGILLREGPAQGVHVVATAQRTSSTLQQLVSLFDSRMLLRMPNRQEHVLAGGSSADYVSGLGAGAAVWQGHRAQIALSASERQTPRRPVSEKFIASELTLVVSPDPVRVAERLRESGALSVVELQASRECNPISHDTRPAVIVADHETWQYHAAAFATLRPTAELLFCQCSLADFRSLTRQRALPPPLADGRASGWLVGKDGTTFRVAIP